MELEYSKNKIIFNKELNDLDCFVVDFTSILNKLKISYVIVSGYVSILFGRNRSSEDIDMFIEKLDLEKFKKLWVELERKFECINETEPEEAYKEYLLRNNALRFAKKGQFIPNIELKFPKIELDFWCLKERKQVIVNKHILLISSLELQIPFKLYLGSEKDIEDAKYLYNLFKDKLDLILLREFNQKFKIQSKFNKYLR